MHELKWIGYNNVSRSLWFSQGPPSRRGREITIIPFCTAPISFNGVKLRKQTPRRQKGRNKKKEETILAEFESAISSEAREQPETGALTITLQDHPATFHFQTVMCMVWRLVMMMGGGEMPNPDHSIFDREIKKTLSMGRNTNTWTTGEHKTTGRYSREWGTVDIITINGGAIRSDEFVRTP